MNLTIPTQPREAFGKNASYRIRRSGRIPAILYGEGRPSLALVLDKKDVIRILKSESGLNTLFKIAIEGGEQDVMIKDVQIDPLTDQLIHADLIQIDMNKTVRVEVPIELVGEAIGVKTEGGFIDFMTRELMVECLPAMIPEHLTVNVSELHLHQSIKVSDVALPEGIKLITDPGAVVALVQVPHEEKVEAAPVVEEEGVEAAAPAEPEVIKKERAEKPEPEK
jgi:large subunit ribosomal protein L25